MIVTASVIFAWAFAFLFFICCVFVFLWMVDEGDPFNGIILFVCMVFCAGFCIVGLKHAEDQYQDRAAKQDLTAAGYTYASATRDSVQLQVGDCLMKLDVHKVNGIYRPTLPLIKRSAAGEQTYGVITPAWQRRTVCPSSSS